MELTLKPDEAALFQRILTNYLSDLRMEIVDTEDYDLRQQLKSDEVTIKAILARFEQQGVKSA